jgi:hypothetical protein
VSSRIWVVFNRFERKISFYNRAGLDHGEPRGSDEEKLIATNYTRKSGSFSLILICTMCHHASRFEHMISFWNRAGLERGEPRVFDEEKLIATNFTSNSCILIIVSHLHNVPSRIWVDSKQV